MEQWRGGHGLHDRLPVSTAFGQRRMQRKHFLQRCSTVGAHHGTGVDRVAGYRLHPTVSMIEKVEIGGAGRGLLEVVRLYSNPFRPAGER